MRTGQNVLLTEEKWTFTEKGSELIVLAVENTYLYPAKESIMLVYCFQPVCHSIVPSL